MTTHGARKQQNMPPCENSKGTSCARCGSGAPPIHAIRNDTLHYCSDCLIAATLKRARATLLSALSPRSLDLGCRLAVAVSSPRLDGSSGWFAWYLLTNHVKHLGRQGLDVGAVHVRFDGDADVGSLEPDAESLCRVVTLDGRALATVDDPTGREDLRRVLVRNALAQELRRGDLDCIVLGDTADALAAGAVSRAAKGQGHLLGDVGMPKEGFAYIMGDLGKDWVAACGRAFSLPGVEDSAEGNRVAGNGVHAKNLHDLARAFATQLLRSNPGGVSNILGTAAKLEGSAAGGKACGLCGEVLADGEAGNRAGVCDACTIGVFGGWHDETRAARTMALLPAEIRSRCMVDAKSPTMITDGH